MLHISSILTSGNTLETGETNRSLQATAGALAAARCRRRRSTIFYAILEKCLDAAAGHTKSAISDKSKQAKFLQVEGLDDSRVVRVSEPIIDAVRRSRGKVALRRSRVDLSEDVEEAKLRRTCEINSRFCENIHFTEHRSLN